MSATPKTDAAIVEIEDGYGGCGQYVQAGTVRDLERELAEARAALQLIAECGGKIVEHEECDGFPPTDCDGDWCAEQALAALEQSNETRKGQT